MSSSLTALITCAAGLIPVNASVPTARSRTRAMRSRATRKFTSASSRAMRTSFSAASTSLSVSRPRLLSRPKMPVSRSVSASNMVSLSLPCRASIVACSQSGRILRWGALDRSASAPICWGRIGGYVVIPLRLKLENFLSYRDAVELDLEGVEVACLCGDNGHGKTAILDAITWALWGGARGRVYGGGGGGSPDELVHQGRPEMSVELDFFVEDARYRVVRKHQAGTPRRSGTTHWDLQVWTGSEYRTVVEGAGVRDTAERIERLLRMDYETFVRSAFLLQGQADRFTASRPAERKETLAEILGLRLYESLERRARESARDSRGRIDRLQGEQENLARELGREAEYREALGSAQAALAELAPHLADLAARRAALQEERHRLEAQRAEAQRLEGDLRGALQQAQALDAQAQDARRRVDAYHAVLARRAEIEAGAAERESVLGRLEALEGRPGRPRGAGPGTTAAPARRRPGADPARDGPPPPAAARGD